MRRSKRRIKKFVDHLFGVYQVPRIPVYIHWYYDVICTETGTAFGVFVNDKNPCIHVAAKQIKTSKLHEVIAHEFTHYLQYLKKRDFDNEESIENDAEYWAAGLYGQWLINKKKKGEHCYGMADIWESKPKEAMPDESCQMVCNPIKPAGSEE